MVTRPEHGEQEQGPPRAPGVHEQAGRDLEEGVGPEEHAQGPAHLAGAQAHLVAGRALDDAQAAAVDIRQGGRQAQAEQDDVPNVRRAGGHPASGGAGR